MNSTDIVLSVISITLLILLLVSATLIVIFRSGRQRIEQQMEVAQTKLNHEKELRQLETEVSEQVLSQLAREMHDNIGQMLHLVKLHMELQFLDRPELKESFKLTATYLSEADKQLRMLSRTLNNDYIGDKGLLTILDMEINRIISLQRLKVHWRCGQINGNSNLNKNQEITVFRIFQEIIHNTLRHSLAKNIFISIHNADGNFELKTEDDGCGFDFKNTLQSPDASGLRNIIKRANWADMECTIYSEPGKGCTTILKKIPILAV
jgi:signal transduction histidine kinase